MSQLNFIERAKEIVIQFNSNKKIVTDIWFNGTKVWPIDKSKYELSVDKNEVTLNKLNNYIDTIKVYCSKHIRWIFGK